MQYIMLCYVNPETRPPVGGLLDEWYDHFDDLGAAGSFVSGSRFQSEETATTVRMRDGEASHSHAPFDSATEMLSGFYIIDVETKEEAIAWAERSPVAPIGAVEVRPLVESAVPKRPPGLLERLLRG